MSRAAADVLQYQHRYKGNTRGGLWQEESAPERGKNPPKKAAAPQGAAARSRKEGKQRSGLLAVEKALHQHRRGAVGRDGHIVAQLTQLAGQGDVLGGAVIVYGILASEVYGLLLWLSSLL